jgi:DNA-binding GntR family transcriptional regulator
MSTPGRSHGLIPKPFKGEGSPVTTPGRSPGLMPKPFKGEGTPAGTAPAALSMVDSAYEQIRKRILDNLWPPGHRALEQEVALALGMSRTPVREALVRLANDGLVEVIPRHGMRVLPVSPTDMREIYEILTALECMAAELLAQRQPADTELTPLLEATQAMDEALAADDLDAWAAADERFHAGLIQLAGNRQLAATVWNYWDRAHRARMFSLKLRPKPVNSTREHRELLERLRAGDAAGAAELNRRHRERASRELLAIFERYRLAQM